jgi:hypothetical protein
VPGLYPIRVAEQLCEQRVAPVNGGSFLHARQHRVDVRLKETHHFRVRRFGERLDAVLSRNDLPCDFRAVLEQLMKHLHVRGMTSTHHAPAAAPALARGGYRSQDSNERCQ